MENRVISDCSEEGSLLEGETSLEDTIQPSNNGQIRIYYLRAHKGKAARATEKLLKKLRNEGRLKIRRYFTPDDTRDPALNHYIVFELGVLPHNAETVERVIRSRGADFCIFCNEHGVRADLSSDPDTG